jgi:hypothetical protein
MDGSLDGESVGCEVGVTFGLKDGKNIGWEVGCALGLDGEEVG